MGVQGCLSFISHQQDIAKHLMILKTTTSTATIQKLCREVQEESVQAI